MFTLTRIRARRRIRWQSQIDRCSDQIASLSEKLNRMDRITEWEKAEAIAVERSRLWNRRNALYAKLTQE